MEIKDFLPVWDRLTKTEQDLLARNATLLHAKKGTMLHSDNAECTGLILVKSGQLRAYIISDEGREITLYRLLERDICLFSASCIMRSIQFDVTIDAEKETEYYLIPADRYQKVMDVSAPLANFTNELMANRFSDVMWLMEQVMWKSFDKRLAAFLLEQSTLENSDSLPITHEAIGNHMGNPREVVTRMLKYFQNEGLVALSRGMIELKDKQGLFVLANAK